MGRLSPRWLLTSVALTILGACGREATLGAKAPVGLEGDEPGECSDGADNDGDGAFDCDDDGCADDPHCGGADPEAPSAPTVSIHPSDPSSSDDLDCRIDGESVAPGGAAVSYVFAWSHDGVDASVDSAALSGAATTRGEGWRCTVTPSAGGVVGPVGFDEVIIGNSPPAGAVAVVQPSAPLEGIDDLICTLAVPAEDTDGDEIAYAVTWTRDGAPAEVATAGDWPGDTVAASHTQADEVWACALVADDGLDAGVAATASVTVLGCDEDGDGYLAPGCGGDDCVDTEATVHPDAVEVCGNGLDDDCDGTANDCRLSGELRSSDAVAMRLGEAAFDYAGSAADGGQDVDGDGLDDWIVGAYAYSGSADHTGVVWLLRGPVSGSGVLSTAHARLHGESGADFAGVSLALAPDLTGDGWVDVVVGASGRDDPGPDAGAVYVVAGPISGDLDLGDADVHIGGAADHARLGNGLAVVEDMDGSGTPGLWLGTYGAIATAGEVGSAVLLPAPLSGTPDVADAVAVVWGEADGDRVGSQVAAADVDGDGISDAVFGVEGHDEAGHDAGTVYLVLGPVTGEIHLADADEELPGERDYDNAGTGVKAVGDVNADGRQDVVVGARGVGISGGGSRDGQAYVVLGPMTVGGLVDAHAELRGESASDRAGVSLGAPGDVDGDGFDDMMVGATDNDAVAEAAGSAYLVYGPVTGRVPLGSADARIRGARGERWGSGLAGGDHDGDGFQDILVGAMYHGDGGEAAGAVAIFKGGGL